ncbi:MAG: TonB-dependent receptor [Flavobacteriaceae bacterium]
MKSKLNKAKTMLSKNAIYAFILQALLVNVLHAGTGVENTTLGEEIVLQQEINISGTITDENGQPLPGASVTIKGTTTGVVANFDGNYKIGAPEDATLVISYIGYTEQEVTVDGRTTIDVQLAPGDALDEVILIGYGTAKKSDLTGAVARIGADAIKNNAQSQVFDRIAGRVAGVNINQSSTPGGSSIIEIRGPTSLTGGTSPLIVLDGVIYNGDIRDINPNDIENIDILKDASSAAVYGSKASSGVIIISTKKGKIGKPTINFSSKISVSEVNNRDFRTRTGKEYEEFRRDYFRTVGNNFPDFYWNDPSDLPSGVTLQDWRDAGNNPADDNTEEYLNRLNFFDLEKEQYRAGNEVNWFNEVMNSGIITENDLSINGGTDKTSYYWSLGQIDNKGIIKGDGASAVRTRLNVDFEIADWLNIGINSHFSERDLSDVRASLQNMFRTSPYAKLRNDDGTLNLFPGEYVNVASPFDNSERQVKERKLINIFAAMYADVKLPLGIKYRFSYQPRYDFERDYNFWGSETLNGGIRHSNGFGTRREFSQFSWLLDHLLTWNNEIGKHRFDLTFLYNQERTKNYESFMSNENFSPNEMLGFNGLGFGIKPALSSNDTEASGNAIMGRLNYIFDNRYFITASVRRDGYSAFGQENPTAIFPAAAFAWTVSNEKFFNVDWVDRLKFRTSWGINGNRDIGIYSSLARVNSTQYSNGSGVQVGVYNNSLSNPGLRWEKTESLNFGLDLGLFNNRVDLTAEYYTITTTDLLQNRQLPEITGFNGVTTNIGELENKGFELSLNTVNIDTQNFSWRSGVVFSFNRNKIISLFGDLDEEGNPLPDYSNQWFPGQSIDVIWDYKVEGVWQANEAAEANAQGFVPGDYKAQDLNNDGQYDALIDKQFIGFRTPRYRWGFRNEFKYKRLVASVFVRADVGHKGVFSPATHQSSTYDRRSIWNIPYWTPTNGEQEFARVNENRGLYGGGLDVNKSRTFIRLQDISLSYDISVPENMGIKSLRVFASARNILTWTKWPGWDPERSSTNLNGDLPMPRTFTMGINVSL